MLDKFLNSIGLCTLNHHWELYRSHKLCKEELCVALDKLERYEANISVVKRTGLRVVKKVDYEER